MANIEIGGRLHSTATGNVVTGANEVLDDTKNKKQSVINAEVDETIGDDNTEGTIKGRIKAVESDIETLNGDSSTSGSVAKAVADAKTELIGGATSDGNTLKKVEDKIQAESQARQDAITAETNRATTREDQIFDLVHTPEQHYVTVLTYAALASISNPSDDTIYRVSSYNGKTNQVDNTVYSEYGYNGTNFVFLCVKSQIDEVYDISAHHSNNTYVDLAAALDGGNNIPQELHRGGMSIKFVQSSDNKYVQYRCIADNFTTDTTQWAVDDAGVYVDNPEWIKVVKDKEGRILYGVKTDGKFYFGAGCPPQVQEYVQSLIDAIEVVLVTKVNKEEGKSLINSEFASSQDVIENIGWLELIKDINGKISEGVNDKGEKVINLPIDTPSCKNSHIENPEWAYVFLSKKKQVLFGIKKDGTFEFSKGIPTPIKQYIESYIKQLPGDEDKFLRRTREQLEYAYSIGYARQTDFNTPDHLPAGWIPPLVFLHVSDTHGNTDRPQMRNAIKALNYMSVNGVNKGRNASFLLHTGDIKYSYFTDDFTYFQDAVAEANKPVFLAIGNHDAGNSKTISLCGTASQIYDQMIAPYIDGWNLTTANEGTPHPSGKNYYFKDFSAEKIRMIVLFEYESDYTIDPEDNTKYLYQIGKRAFSQAQINWLIDSLSTTPEDYGVIIVKHQPENYRGSTESEFNAISARGEAFGETFVSRNIICDIVNAFKNKEHLESTYEQNGGIVTTLDVDADFSGKTTTEFICYVSGHSHVDGISFTRDYANQLELNIGCDNTHYIFNSDIAQSPDSISEDLINVYSIDRNNKKLCVARIGANMSNMAQHRVAEVFNY